MKPCVSGLMASIRFILYSLYLSGTRIAVFFNTLFYNAANYTEDTKKCFCITIQSISRHEAAADGGELLLVCERERKCLQRNKDTGWCTGWREMQCVHTVCVCLSIIIENKISIWSRGKKTVIRLCKIGKQRRGQSFQCVCWGLKINVNEISLCRDSIFVCWWSGFGACFALTFKPIKTTETWTDNSLYIIIQLFLSNVPKILLNKRI